LDGRSLSELGIRHAHGCAIAWRSRAKKLSIALEEKNEQ
jgi:hypothetical protein